MPVFNDLKRWEAREIGENYKALLNTKQLKKAKAGKKPRRKEGGAGGYEFPLPPTPNNHKPVPIIEYEFLEKKCLQDLSGLSFSTFLAVLLSLSRQAYHGDN